MTTVRQATGSPLPAWPVPAVIAASALAFGAVYPWGYWPLAIACAGLGALCLATGWSRRPRLVVALLAVAAAAVALQVVPMPVAVVVRMSPATDAWLRDHTLGYALGAAVSGGGTSPLSIAPDRTAVALALFTAFGLFLAGTSVLLGGSTRAPRTVAIGIVLTGSVLAIAGLAQRALFNGKLYGVWQPEAAGGSPFGPFVNRNHFAGWMLMAVPIGLGYLAALASRGMRGAAPGWRGRLLWLSGRDATETVLVGVAVALMMVTLVFNLSRSGLGGLVLALVVMAFFSVRHQSSRGRKALSVGYLAVLALAVATWAGADVLTKRFDRRDGLGLDGRQVAWQQALAIARDFPVTGAGLNTYGLIVAGYESAGQPRRFYAAHNDYLQVAAEGGLLVGIPALALLAALAALAARRLREPSPSRTTHWIRVGAAAGLIAIAFQSLVDFSLQIPANAVLFAVLCALATHPAAARPSRGIAEPASSQAALPRSRRPASPQRIDSHARRV